MINYDFTGAAMLPGCTPNSGSVANLIEETCEWVCKRDRPVVRCTWRFDKDGIYGNAGGSAIDRCWIEQECGPMDTGKTQISVTCKPTTLWMLVDSQSSALADL